MKIEQEYIDTLLKPLQDDNVPTLGEYFETISDLGVEVSGEDGRIDRRFETHFKYLSSKGLISNLDGYTDLKSIGIAMGAGGHMSIVGSNYIMKTQFEELVPSMTNTFNIGSIAGDQIQVGNENTQTVNIKINELVDAVAKSDDPQAKSALRNLLKNSTVGSIIGAGVSTLLAML